MTNIQPFIRLQTINGVLFIKYIIKYLFIININSVYLLLIIKKAAGNNPNG